MSHADDDHARDGVPSNHNHGSFSLRAVFERKMQSSPIQWGWQPTANALAPLFQYQGAPPLKLLAVFLGVFSTGMWLAVAAVSSPWGPGPNDSLLADGGPGELWIPPDERPVPLSEFPDFTGLGFISKAERDRERARREENAEMERDQGKPQVTLLFMHLWKCAGSSLRHMLRDWAELEEQSIAIVVRCTEEITQDGKICLKDHQLIDSRVQGPYIRRNQVLAGHFTWGFQYHVRQPYVMFTTLRNPLELFVSGQQYLNRKATKRFSNAVELAGATMRYSIERYKVRYGAIREAATVGEVLEVPEVQGGKAMGFMYRLVEPEIVDSKTLDAAARQAMNNLDTFWLVGVVEQYRGFMIVLREMMDPLRRHSNLWKACEVGRFNTSPNGAGKVLAGIEAIHPGLVREFNETLRQQWEVYEHAKQLFGDRCREILHTRNYDLCGVPSAASEYAMADFEKELLYEELHVDAASSNGSEALVGNAGN